MGYSAALRLDRCDSEDNREREKKPETDEEDAEREDFIGAGKQNRWHWINK